MNDDVVESTEDHDNPLPPSDSKDSSTNNNRVLLNKRRHKHRHRHGAHRTSGSQNITISTNSQDNENNENIINNHDDCDEADNDGQEGNRTRTPAHKEPAASADISPSSLSHGGILKGEAMAIPPEDKSEFDLLEELFDKIPVPSSSNLDADAALDDSPTARSFRKSVKFCFASFAVTFSNVVGDNDVVDIDGWSVKPWKQQKSGKESSDHHCSGGDDSAEESYGLGFTGNGMPLVPVDVVFLLWSSTLQLDNESKGHREHDITGYSFGLAAIALMRRKQHLS
eukprot:13639962-Ditylum_brightwellii.AAC.1